MFAEREEMELMQIDLKYEAARIKTLSEYYLKTFIDI
jgi:hypothetical protein